MVSTRKVNEWTWWAGHSEEIYSTECGSREEAKATVIHEYEGGWICEAIIRPIDLSECFDASVFVEDLEVANYSDWIGDRG